MTEQGVRKLKTAYGIGLSVLTAIVGVLFILQTWSIFFSAEKSPYTVEIIGEKLLQILIPVCVWVLGVIGGGVMHALFPDEEKSVKGYVSPKRMLQRLKARLPKNEGGMSALSKKERLCQALWIACVTLIISTILKTVLILFNDAHTQWLQGDFFTSHNAVADRLIQISVSVGICMAWLIFAVFAQERIIQQKIVLVKAQIAENAKKGVKPAQLSVSPTWKDTLLEKFPILQSPWWKKGFQIGLFVVGITLCIIGIANGGMADVFEKARNICTQCIGLG